MALNTWRHLYSAGLPSHWAMAHILVCCSFYLHNSNYFQAGANGWLSISLTTVKFCQIILWYFTATNKFSPNFTSCLMSIYFRAFNNQLNVCNTAAIMWSNSNYALCTVHHNNTKINYLALVHTEEGNLLILLLLSSPVLVPNCNPSWHSNTMQLYFNV